MTFRIFRLDPEFYPFPNRRFRLLGSYLNLVFFHILPDPSLIMNTTMIIVILVLTMYITRTGGIFGMSWAP